MPPQPVVAKPRSIPSAFPSEFDLVGDVPPLLGKKIFSDRQTVNRLLDRRKLGISLVFVLK